MPQTFNPDDFDTKIQADEFPNTGWDEEMTDEDTEELDEDTEELDEDTEELDEDTEELDEDIDPFDDDDVEASPDADDEDNWDQEDDVQGRWNGDIIYGYDKEMSECEAAFYGEDRDYDAMNDYYGDGDDE